MIAFVLLLIIALLLGLRRRTEDNGAKTWLSKETTTAINGFWILIVFLSHANSNISRAGYQYAHFGDNIYKFFFGFVGQLMVAMFLFNSGFGVMESIKAKGESYIRTMPKRRMLATLLNIRRGGFGVHWHESNHGHIHDNPPDIGVVCLLA